MNVHQKVSARSYTVDEFLTTFEGVEGKHELVDGVVSTMMTNVTYFHAEVTSALCAALRAGLPDNLTALSSDFGVLTKAGVRYPDVLVRERDGANEMTTQRPLVIAEILSKTTMAQDFGEKANEYRAIDSLQHYLIFEQAEPRMWMINRAEDGWTDAQLVEGIEAEISLDKPKLTLAMRSIYGGIV
ncbi:MAG: Uma2 family endonuclease [Ahrensia sp.]|nr:Uma2 family endonuclease [Ahrensia sp.]